ncbi:hypothetical protein JXO52_15580 [bacterium]|nr:hypothetical protein [bacterium]
MTGPGHAACRTARDLLDTASSLGIALPWREDPSSLLVPAVIAGRTVPNRFAVQPMEGFDAALRNGAPGELTFRRYERYGSGGSGLIWFEATSVLPGGRSNPRQLWLHRGTARAFRDLTRRTRDAAARAFGKAHSPFLVLQLTHSGRHARPDGAPAPLAAFHDPALFGDGPEPEIVSDDALLRLMDGTIAAVRLARDAGFDAVDIKACHGYLVHELLFARRRGNSRFGGSFENRVRFLVDTVERILLEVPDVVPAVRLNTFDALPASTGFGHAETGSPVLDCSEPLAAARLLAEKGCGLLNITGGNPYRSPHLVRPYDRAAGSGPPAGEHPLMGVDRLIRAAAAVQRTLPRVPCVGSGYSWLRQHVSGVGAGAVEAGDVSFVGLGRGAFAYPDAPADLMNRGRLDKKKVCVACSLCTELMRGGGPAGCAVRDRGIYGGRSADSPEDQ